MAIAPELAALRSLARRLSEPWPAEERLAQWNRGRPETRGLRLRGLFPHASEPPAGPPDRVTVTSALHPGRTWMSVPDARVRPEHASGNPAGRSRQRPFVEGRARRQDPAAPHPWGRSWMSSIAGVGPVVLRFAADLQPRAVPAAAKHLDRATLGSLAARYTPRRPDGSYNRHDARRWMRAFARNAAAQASDALEEGRPGARRLAIGALCSMIGLDDAIRLTERSLGLADHVSMTVEPTQAPESAMLLVEPRDYEIINFELRAAGRPPAREFLIGGAIAVGLRLEQRVTLRGRLETVDAVVTDVEYEHDRVRPAPRATARLREVVRAWLTATGAALDAEAARHGLQRRTGLEGPDATPWGDEPDEALRARIEQVVPPGARIDDIDFEPRIGRAIVCYSTV